MNINGKRSSESLDPVFLVHFPECKRSEIGIRPRNIRKFRLAKENSKKLSFISQSPNENRTPSNKSYFRPNRFMIKSKIPFDLRSAPIEKQRNIAYFSFLPDNDENLCKNLKKPPIRCRSLRYGKESQSKGLEKCLKPKHLIACSEGGKRFSTVSTCQAEKAEEKDREALETPNKWTEVFNEISDEEESPLKDFSNVLKPRFNL